MDKGREREEKGEMEGERWRITGEGTGREEGVKGGG